MKKLAIFLINVIYLIYQIDLKNNKNLVNQYRYFLYKAQSYMKVIFKK